jgi:hypothetical protein
MNTIPEDDDPLTRAVTRIMQTRPKHMHICACGSYLMCSREADRCAIVDPWTCESCGLDQQDAAMSEQERRTRG